MNRQTFKLPTPSEKKYRALLASVNLPMKKVLSLLASTDNGHCSDGGERCFSAIFLALFIYCHVQFSKIFVSFIFLYKLILTSGQNSRREKIPRSPF